MFLLAVMPTRRRAKYLFGELKSFTTKIRCRKTHDQIANHISFIGVHSKALVAMPKNGKICEANRSAAN
jgi:hypothetical protein